MLGPTVRPLVRTARQYPTQPFRASKTTRNVSLASLTLALGTLAYTSRSQTLRADERVRQSVLDQPSLKTNIHVRDRPEIAPEGQGMIQGKEKQATTEGAFNEETGEINWDCPCLGGMADGPCGENFKAAFSCFVFSEAEPKGMDCVDRFKNMQDCFREHPDIYGEEIDDDEEDNSPQPVTGTVTPDTVGVPKTPNKNPPRNSPTLGATPENTMTKNTNKLHLTRDKSRHIPNFNDEEEEKGKK